MKKTLEEIAREFGISFEKAKEEFKDIRPDGYLKRLFEVPTYDEDTINQVAIDNNEMQYFEWYCDECAAYLNIQEGFNCETGEWECTNCGNVNKINKDNIVM